MPEAGCVRISLFCLFLCLGAWFFFSLGGGRPFVNLPGSNSEMLIAWAAWVVECYIVPILTYGSESWTINNAAVNAINAAEMWYLRKMQRLLYIERITNEEVLRRAETRRRLCVKIRERQARFFGHVMRRDGLENIITTGMVNGKKSRARSAKHLNGLKMQLQKENSINT